MCSVLSEKGKFTIDNPLSYQTNKNTKQLNDISISYRVEPPNQSVEYGHAC